MIDPNFDRVVTITRIMGRDISALLKNNPVSLQQIYDILDTGTQDDEYSQLAISMKMAAPYISGMSSSISYKTAYDALIALKMGITDWR
jgi:hypothetical protein